MKIEHKRLVRKRMIECVLSTDIMQHQSLKNRLIKKIQLFDIKQGKNVDKLIFEDNDRYTFENQQLVLSIIIHSSDISNPCKPTEISQLWVQLLFHEFFKQGDLEKKQNLPVSLLCDRQTTCINKSQLGFIKYIVKPTFTSLMCIAPEIVNYYENILKNEENYINLTTEDPSLYSNNQENY